MAGIYLHIPFCRKACHYCDFHFSTNFSLKTELVEAMAKEIALRSHYLNEPVKTIYFGGGTPSVLSASDLGSLLAQCQRHFTISANPEITLEANPDDLNAENLRTWKEMGINRLSIGIQSFHDAHLQMLNRTHTAAEAENGVKRAQDVGLPNISIDLIYGIPAETHAIWEADVAKAMQLLVPHLSAYCLTIEEKTAFGKWAKTGRFVPATDEFEVLQLEHLLSALAQNGYQQYEVSNFCKGENYSRHNTAYWQQKPYLGIGPGAHSFDRISRQANVANNARYVKSLAQNELPFERELLRKEDQVNEYFMTGLRTKWGVNVSFLLNQYGFDLEAERAEILQQWIKQGWCTYENRHLILTSKGRLLADQLAAELFIA